MAGGETTPPLAKIETNSLFFLGAQDRPSDFITPVRLKLDNFDDWVHAIFVALSSHRKFGFLDVTIMDLVPPAKTKNWVTIHCMVVSWLTNMIDPEVKSMLSNYYNAKHLWDDLHERFCVVNDPQIQQAEINRCEQTKTMPVVIYFSKLKVLWDDLAKFEPLISCKCGKCTYDVGRQHEKRREDDRLQQFLLGLCSEYYAPLRSNILSQDPLPSLNPVFQQVAQDERVRGIAQIKDEKAEVTGFAVRMETHTKPRLSRAKNAALICIYCRKSGHDNTTCFELHGVPDWYSEKYGTSNNDAKGAAKGKFAAVGRGRVKAKATTSDALQDISAEQLRALFAALSTPPPSNRLCGKWIIDTGCSHHVTENLACITDLVDVTPCHIELPNGRSVLALKECIVKLSTTISLRNILCVPKLKCNLISVSQLSDDLNCFVTTNAISYIIQDQQTREVIGTAERRD